MNDSFSADVEEFSEVRTDDWSSTNRASDDINVSGFLHNGTKTIGGCSAW